MAGVFKTAVESQPDGFPAAEKKRLLRLADSLVEDAAT
jgi:hypothetical protein